MKRFRHVPPAAALFALLASGAQMSAAGPLIGSRSYTLDADFAQGTLLNVNYDPPNSDQLQLNLRFTTFPVMWIANAGEDTVSRIDTTTGREVARYRTWFGPAGQPGYYNHLGNEYAGAAPSRTAVDADGNCYVANRHFDSRPADVVKILATGGIDRNGNGVIDTSVDLDSNGVIDPSEILPMGDANGNGAIDPEEIGDERIAWVAPVGPVSGLGRSLAISPDGTLWLGLFNTRTYYQLDPTDGHVLAGPIDVSPNTPYGSLVDGDGFLWGASLGGNLLKLDTKPPYTVSVLDHSAFGYDYGIAIGNGKVYQASQNGLTYIQFDPATGTFSAPAALRFTALGVAVDSNGDIFAGNYYNGGLTKFRPDGSVIWTAPPQPGAGEARGCVVDSDGNVWLVHRTSNNVSKYDGTNGAPLGVFPTGAGPYTYSDATGLGRAQSNPTGNWTVIHDSGVSGTPWGTASWSGLEPTGTSLKVEVRSAETLLGLEGQNYQVVQNGVPFCNLGLVGQFIQVKVTFARAASVVNTPVLYDLTIQCCRRDITLLANADTFLREGARDTNEGGNQYVRLQASGDNRGLFGFDFTGVPFTNVTKATLYLTIAEKAENWGNDVPRTVSAHRILTSWTEGNGNNSEQRPFVRGSGAGATWNCPTDTNITNTRTDPLGGLQWRGGNGVRAGDLPFFAPATGPGVDHHNDPVMPPGTVIAFDVTQDVLDAAQDGLLFGWLVKKDNEDQSGKVLYYTREGANARVNPALAPTLVLDYQ